LQPIQQNDEADLFITTYSHIILCSSACTGSLPDFSVEDVGISKVRISWIHSFGDNCIQLMVQSSYDSVKNLGPSFQLNLRNCHRMGLYTHYLILQRNYISGYFIFSMATLIILPKQNALLKLLSVNLRQKLLSRK
jgi:hypothetical protein